MASPKPPLTHFLCIPLATPSSRPHLLRSLSVLRADVSEPDPRGGPALLPPDAIRPPGSLHLTLGVMSFPRNEGLNTAIELLHGLKPRQMLRDATAAAVAMMERMTSSGFDEAPVGNDRAAARAGAPARTPDPSALTISLRGLRAMGHNPTRASVLYAPPVDDLGILQRFCYSVRSAFCAAGLILDEDRPLLLHATLINTVYVRGNAVDRSSGTDSRGGRGGAVAGRARGGGRQSRGGGRRAGRLEVDATALLDRYRGQVWLEGLPLDRITICKMGARAVEAPEGGQPDAEYEVVSEIRF